MNPKLVRPSEIVEERFGSISVKQLLNQEDIENISVAVITIDGKNKRVMNTQNDAIYYVLRGEGYFTIDDEKNILQEGDLIFIPKGTIYFDEGNMTLLAINSPRFVMEQVKYLDEKE